MPVKKKKVNKLPQTWPSARNHTKKPRPNAPKAIPNLLIRPDYSVKFEAILGAALPASVKKTVKNRHYC